MTNNITELIKQVAQARQNFIAAASGLTEILKEKFTNLNVFAVEPGLSPVISGGAPGPHPLQGIGAGFVPSILNTALWMAQYK
ncbi:MAG: hypothetical protein WKG06_45575 [Segetibacter sp.]